MVILALLAAYPAFAQLPQNPSPMVEHRRPHPRLLEQHPPGRRESLSLGTLFIPPRPRPHTLLFFFHGGTWLPEVAAAKRRLTVITIQIGAGSAVYSRAFASPSRFGKLIAEAEAYSGVTYKRILLAGWSAGNGAIRAILRDPDSYPRVSAVLDIDGMHAGYVNGKPDPRDLDIWAKLSLDAIAGKKRFLITHSEIYPGTFASTTETADWLLDEIHLKAKPVLRHGPMGTQQLSEAKKGKFLLRGFAGNSAPDHVDQLHSLPDYLRWLLRR